MCQRCVDALNKYFPDKSEEEKMNILWNFTAFPAGDGEMVERQLKHLSEVGPEAVMAEFDKAWDEHEQEEAEEAKKESQVSENL